MDEVFASVMVVVLQIAPLEGLFKQMLPTAQHATVTPHLVFDTGTRPRLCLFKANTRSRSLPKELAQVHHYAAVCVAIYTQIPTQLHGVYFSDWCK